ncbi:MAG: hypothetical protein KAR13_23055 [Desulfobulbaceae bacterium]|nr:hypothetical protein [Desulfobulbaceae bacterium]
MGTLEIKNQIHSTIDNMPPEKLDAIIAFLEDLRLSSEDETAMLMSEPDFMKDYQDAKKDIRFGKTVSFKAIRRDA